MDGEEARRPLDQEASLFDGPGASAAHNWVALATHPHKEQVALENLERQGFSAYCPKIRKTVRHARRSRDVLRPLFPGYVFASFSRSANRWRGMASTFGVRRVIAFGGTPCLLSSDFISSLKAREVDGALTRPATPYRLGQTVCLTSGAFEGLVATIIEMDEKQRLVVLLDLLNQSVRVKTDYKGVREL